MTEWKPEGTERWISDGRVQYLRGAHHHEGAHEVTLPDGGTLTVYPDGTTTTRKRAGAIRTALGRSEMFGADIRMRILIGSLVMAGATHLYLNDEPLVGTGITGGGRWRLDLASDGEVRATWIGAGP